MIRSVKISEERIGVLIGQSGKTRKEIEKRTNTKIDIGEDIVVKGDALNVMTAENIIRAIGRGFSPKNAFELLDDENTISIISLPKNPATLIRVRARLIGTNGKCRHNIEIMTRTKISIYGKTASIIGKYEDVELAENAIKKLIMGIPHKNVYQYLENRNKQI